MAGWHPDMIIFYFASGMWKKKSCAYYQYSDLLEHVYRLISFRFLFYRASSKKKTLVRLCDLSLPFSCIT